MIRRCEPSHRRYTELCNRSGSSQLRPAHPHTQNVDVLEDYWEDASVSLRSYHSWEAPSSAWLNDSSTHLMIAQAHEESKNLCNLSSHIRPCRYSFDASDHLGSLKGRRSFPPPLASCSTLSIKEGGRFVLKEMDIDRPQGFFRAQRENGRLLLRLVLPDELNDEDVATASDDHDGTDEEDDADEDEDSLSVVECAVGGAGSGLCDEFGHVEHDAHDVAFARINHSDDISNKEEVIHTDAVDRLAGKANLDDCDCACRPLASECEVSDSVRQGLAACLTSQDMSKEVGSRMQAEDVNYQVGPILLADGFSLKKSLLDTSTIWNGLDMVDTNHHGCSDANRFVVKSSFCEGQGDVLAAHQQELLWNPEAANHVMASLTPWSSNQLCLHQSLVAM